MTTKIDELSKVLGQIGTSIDMLKSSVSVLTEQGKVSNDLMIRQDMTILAIHKRLDEVSEATLATKKRFEEETLAVKKRVDVVEGKFKAYESEAKGATRALKFVYSIGAATLGGIVWILTKLHIL